MPQRWQNLQTKRYWEGAYYLQCENDANRGEEEGEEGPGVEPAHGVWFDEDALVLEVVGYEPWTLHQAKGGNKGIVLHDILNSDKENFFLLRISLRKSKTLVI